MERHKILARSILEVIQQRDNDGCGIARTEFYPVIKHVYEVPEGGDVVTIVDYHLHLLETAGFVYCEMDEESSGGDLYQLTWSGHDFIESNDL